MWQRQNSYNWVTKGHMHLYAKFYALVCFGMIGVVSHCKLLVKTTLKKKLGRWEKDRPYGISLRRCDNRIKL
jgi:hypothetical protein